MSARSDSSSGSKSGVLADARARADAKIAEADAEPVIAADPSLILQTGELGKDYGDGLGLVSLDLEVGPGELIMLVGPNGAGKSTFLGLTSGLVEPSTGTAYVAGFPIGSIEARAATSFLPDAPVLYDDLSVNEHIEYTARLHGELDWPERACLLYTSPSPRD